MSYQNYYQPVIPAQMQAELAVYQQKQIISANVKISEEAAKANIRENVEMRKESRREYRKECNRARYCETVIDEDGWINIKPRNKLVEVPKRRIANFQFADIYELKNIEGDSGIFLLEMEIAKRTVRLYREGRKDGNAGYLMKKIASAGGEIFMQKKSDKEAFLQSLWALLLKKCGKKQLYSTHTGWIRLQNGGYQFIREGAILWKDIVEMAK